MWAHYADRHRGVCLSFDVPDDHASMYEVTYVSRLLPVLTVERYNADPESSFLTLINSKFDDWKYEDEIRLWYDKDILIAEGDKCFVSFDEQLVLREVIIGYMSSTTESEVIAALTKNGNDTVNISKMTPSYHAQFQMVRDEEWAVSMANLRVRARSDAISKP